ncbi:Hypothetical predicted protein [Paramuricea clavata]|uniref:Uncharacterized protein n=1 Tax=Paramuricea clavata TaxID=317549 RepID=A0A6S7K941_PARCT|nr:Hypothetical predicted protein [Paramuricea clavata]
MKYETKASGISPKVTEFDTLIEEMLEKEEASEELRATQEKCCGYSEKKAMERFEETKKGEIEEKKRKRRSGSDTLQFIMEQSENEMNMRGRELALEKEKQTRKEQKHNDFKEMALQMAQQQVAQFQMMFMQQNNLMLSILEKKSS